MREPGGFYLPNGPREGTFATADGQGATSPSTRCPRAELAPGQLLMMTIRSHDQFNTTIYGLDDRYRGIHSERRVVLMNAEDIRERGLADGQMVDLTSHFQGETRASRARFVVRGVRHPPPLRRDLLPRGQRAGARSAASPSSSNTPASKSVVVTVAPSEGSRPGASRSPRRGARPALTPGQPGSGELCWRLPLGLR